MSEGMYGAQPGGGTWYSEAPVVETATLMPVGSGPVPATLDWTTIATDRGIVLASSLAEYAVYDGSATYGRWPRTDDGYRFAYEMYHARLQSSAHAIAYAATGYEDPVRLGLPTEAKLKSTSYASPLSFVGSTRRILSWASSASQRNAGVAVLVWTLAIVGLLVAWTFLLGWYFIIFGIFGILVIPWRLMRRGQRKNMHIQKTALATQQAMLAQQQAMMRQMQQGGRLP